MPGIKADYSEFNACFIRDESREVHHIEQTVAACHPEFNSDNLLLPEISRSIGGAKHSVKIIGPYIQPVLLLISEVTIFGDPRFITKQRGPKLPMYPS